MRTIISNNIEKKCQEIEKEIGKSIRKSINGQRIGMISLRDVIFFIYSGNKAMGRFKYMKNQAKLILFMAILLAISGCAKEVKPLPETLPENKPIAFGKIQAYLTGPTNRWYPPQSPVF